MKGVRDVRGPTAELEMVSSSVLLKGDGFILRPVSYVNPVYLNVWDLRSVRDVRGPTEELEWLSREAVLKCGKERGADKRRLTKALTSQRTSKS